MTSLHCVRARLRQGLRWLTCVPLLGGCAVQVGDERVGQSSDAVTVCAAGTVVQGVDVSVYQATVDWPTVKAAGLDFAIARISDGTSLDTDFATNWTGMKSAGLLRGAYQFFEPGQDPMAQAAVVVGAVGKLGAGDLPVTADMEVTGGQSAAAIAANLQTWMTAVQAGTGKTPMVYAASGFWDGSVGSSAFASNPLWVANWGATCPSMPTGWSAWAFWQHSDTGTVAGISGNVDLDEYNGTLAQLQTFAGGGGTAPDGGVSGTYGAQYVSQSWPLASMTMTMTTCQTQAVTLTLKNTGTLAWDSKTRLATTNPRDRVSAFGDSTWLLGDRAAAVTGTVAPGGTYEFKFDFHAPPTTGSSKEYFGLVEEGVVWFGDPGQGGPADTDLEANIQVTAGATDCVVDPGVPDGGATPIDGGAEDGGLRGDAAADTGNDGGKGDAASGPPDAGQPAFQEGDHGCGCATAGAAGTQGGAIAGVAVALAALTRRKRRCVMTHGRT